MTELFRKKRIRTVIITAAVMLLAAAVLCLVMLPSGRCLKLSDASTGRVFLRLPVADGDRFSVTFIHSVNKTPVTDVYEIRGKDIYVVECRFYNFGAGMQTDYPEGTEMTYADDGAIVVTGYNTLMNGVTYCVGMVSDHVLEISGKTYSLRDICGRGSMVQFNVR